MKLIKGLSILSLKEDSIEINDGSLHHSKMEINNLDFPFNENAFVPKNNWRPLKYGETELLRDNNEEFTNYIRIGKLSENIIKIAKEMNFSKYKERNMVFQQLRKNSHLLELFNDEVHNFVLSLSTKNDDFEFHRLSVIPSGRYVTSINLNNETFEFLGLHIDHSTHFTIENADLSRNRICINLSEEDRYLYFINLSLKQIKKLLTENYGVKDISLENITEFYFKYLSDYPVLRLRQKPYEYYIAPTDNCLHDGSTMNNKFLDITLTYLGYFR